MSKLQELIRELCPDGVEYKKLGEIGTFTRGNGLQKKDFTESGVGCIHYGQIYTYYGTWATKTVTYCSPQLAKKLRVAHKGDIVIATTSENVEDVCKAVAWLGDDDIVVSGDAYIFAHNQNSKYVSYIFQTQSFFDFKRKNQTGTKVIRVSGESMAKFEIPVPPLPVQEEIVRILDHFTNLAAELQAELQARKEQYEYYRNKLLTFGKNAERIEWKRLEDVLHSIRTGLNPRKFFKVNTPDATSYYVTIREFNGGNLTFTDSTDRINETARILCNNRSNLEYNDVLFSGTGTIGETYVIDNIPSNWNIKEGVYSLKPKIHIILPKYLKYILSQSDIKASYLKLAEGGTVKSISMRKLGNFPIPVPSLSEQQRIVSILDKFEALVNDLSEGLPAEIAAVQEQYEYYRNKLLSFPKLAVA